MLGLDIVEGEAEEHGAILRRDVVGLPGDAAGNRAIVRQLLGGHETQLLEEGVIGRQVAEQLDDRLGDAPAHLGQRLRQSCLREELEEARIGGEGLRGEARIDGRAEQHVRRHGRHRVVALGIEGLDELAEFGCQQAMAKLAAGVQHAGLEIVAGGVVEPAAQTLLIDIARHLDEPQDLEEPAVDGQIGVRTDARRVDPVGVDVEQGIAGGLGLGKVVLRKRAALGIDGVVAHAIEQAIANAHIGEVGLRPGIGEAAADEGLRKPIADRCLRRGCVPLSG